MRFLHLLGSQSVGQLADEIWLRQHHILETKPCYGHKTVSYDDLIRFNAWNVFFPVNEMEDNSNVKREVSKAPKGQCSIASKGTEKDVNVSKRGTHSHKGSVAKAPENNNKGHGQKKQNISDQRKNRTGKRRYESNEENKKGEKKSSLQKKDYRFVPDDSAILEADLDLLLALGEESVLKDEDRANRMLSYVRDKYLTCNAIRYQMNRHTRLTLPVGAPPDLSLKKQYFPSTMRKKDKYNNLHNMVDVIRIENMKRRLRVEMNDHPERGRQLRHLRKRKLDSGSQKEAVEVETIDPRRVTKSQKRMVSQEGGKHLFQLR